MKILVTGANGQLGRELTLALDGKHELIAASRQRLDVTDGEQIYALLLHERPHAIIHAAAFTDVDRAESEPAAAYAVNASSVARIASAAERIGAKLVYISTDYVFDGRQNEPYRERDVPLPLNVYGKSKLRGEKFAQLYCSRSFVVRTAWLYGRTGLNFVGKVIEQARRHGRMSLVDDQFGSPTNATDLAEWIGMLIETDLYGIYHAANRGVCSRYGFGTEIMRIMDMPNIRLERVGSDAFPLQAPRPAYSALDDEAARLQDLPRMRDWREALYDYLKDAGSR